jgi:hypothetical protein
MNSLLCFSYNQKRIYVHDGARKQIKINMKKRGETVYTAFEMTRDLERRHLQKH